MEPIIDILNVFVLYCKRTLEQDVIKEIQGIDYSKDTFESECLDLLFGKMEEEKRFKCDIKRIIIYGAGKVIVDGKETEVSDCVLSALDFADIKEEDGKIVEVKVYNADIETVDDKKTVYTVFVHNPTKIHMDKLDKEDMKHKIKRLTIYDYEDPDTQEFDAAYILEVNGKQEKMCYSLLPLIRYVSLIPDWAIIKWNIYKVQAM